MVDLVVGSDVDFVVGLVVGSGVDLVVGLVVGFESLVGQLVLYKKRLFIITFTN